MDAESRTEGVVRVSISGDPVIFKIGIDKAGDVAYNPPIMDSLNDLRSPAEALSSLLSWNWWAASPAR
jgi:hypothetical protein